MTKLTKLEMKARHDGIRFAVKMVWKLAKQINRSRKEFGESVGDRMISLVVASNITLEETMTRENKTGEVDK